MKKLYTILFTLTISNIISQEIIEEKNRQKNEVYHVLKTDKNIKHGPYKKYFKRKLPRISGQYKDDKKDGVWKYYFWDGSISKIGSFENGLKDSIWTRYVGDGRILEKGRFSKGKKNGEWLYYYWDSGIPSSIGHYEKGHKVGVWSYTNKHGTLIHKFDHTLNELIYYTTNEDASSEQPNELLNDSENHKRMILGGNEGLLKHIRIQFQYPEEAQLNGVTGKVYVHFTVDENLEMKNFFAENDPGYGIGEEAVRLIKTGPLWLPKKINGIYENSKGTFPITFNLQ
ncbi:MULTISPECIES: energy transducer TonB [Flavobacteriaceae]|uniref:energy transducer TonB n=1 Tax=Flavobacteriaceae TaxID=49546 RepID=UPI0014931B80|nr:MULTISPECIES: energy transducer TonB [Allomuricauda]MDC6367194.1 energy transducer TonB [Muricauda sp. AC10]